MKAERKESDHMKKDAFKIEGTAPRVSRRALELFADNRFKPRVVRSKRVYSRKRVDKDNS